MLKRNIIGLVILIIGGFFIWKLAVYHHPGRHTTMATVIILSIALGKLIDSISRKITSIKKARLYQDDTYLDNQGLDFVKGEIDRIHTANIGKTYIDENGNEYSCNDLK